MGWQEIPYAIPLIVASHLLAISAVYTWVRGKTSWTKTGAALVAVGAVWTIGYALELVSASPQAKLLWNKIQYVAISVIPTGCLIFALQYTGHEGWLTRRRLALLSIVPIIAVTLFLLSNYHRLLWVGDVIGGVGRHLDEGRSYRAGYWLLMSYSFALFLLGFFLFAQALVRSWQLYRWQVVAFLLTGLMIMAGGVIELLGDFSPGALALPFALAALIGAAGLTTMQPGDIKSMSRGAILKSMTDAVLVLDVRGRVVDLNPAAQTLVGFEISEIVGQSLRQIWPDWPVQVTGQENVCSTNEAVKLGSKDGERMYDVRTSAVLDWRSRVAGCVVVLRDVTERVQAEAVQRQAEEDLRQRTAQLEALREVGLELTAKLNLEELLRSIASRAVELGGWSSGGLYLYRPERDVLEWVVPVGPYLAPAGTTLRRGEGLSGKVWETGEPIVVGDYKHWEGQAKVYEEYSWTAVVGVPIRWGDEFLGVLNVLGNTPRAFSTADAELLELFANQAAIAIQNARLFQREREQRELAEALTEAAAIVGSTLDLNRVLDRILEQVERVVAGDAFNIMLVEGDMVRMARRRGYERLAGDDDTGGRAFPITQYPNLQKMMLSKKPLVVSDVADDPDWVPQEKTEWRRSYVAAPILIGNVVVGFLGVSGIRLGQFGLADARRLEVFALHAARALENARLYQQTERRLAQSQVLLEVMLAAASTLNFDEVLRRTVDTLQALIGVEFLGFALPMAEEEALRYHPAQIGFPPQVRDTPIPLDHSICGRVFRTGAPVLTEDVAKSPYYLEGHPEVRSELAVPVRIGGRVIGVLNLESRHLSHFSEDDLAFYTTVAGQLGMALENARLYEEIRHHADELASALMQLQELDRLKSEFIQNVSHELRSPLALIRGYAEVLASGDLGKLPGRHQGPVEIIVRRSRMLGDMVNDITLLLSAEKRGLRQEPIALDEMVQAAVEDFQIAANQAELTLRAEIVPGVPPLLGAPTYLRRVLDNLLGNAIKFTPCGGTVTVRVWPENEQVVLQVVDTGIGIPPEQQERIFERFYQVDGSSKRRYGGVGLGLALVKEIVEAHSGTVGIESQVGRGSTFTVTLPVLE